LFFYGHTKSKVFIFLFAATPFHFTGNSFYNQTANKSTTKPVFDLKASLARPVTWKPYVGKLKPVGDTMYAQPPSATKQEPTVSRVDVFKSAVNKTRMTYSRYLSVYEGVSKSVTVAILGSATLLKMMMFFFFPYILFCLLLILF
jgi:hypothetical protein